MDVEALLEKRAHPLTDVIEALRKLIRTADSSLVEETKWNAPSYRLEEHLLTFQLAKDERVLLIFHRGAKSKAPKTRLAVDDPQALLTWLGNDRATVAFTSLAEVKKQKAAFTKLVKAWVAAR